MRFICDCHDATLGLVGGFAVTGTACQKCLDSSLLLGEHKISNYWIWSLIPSHSTYVKYPPDVVYLLNCVRILHILGLGCCRSISMMSVSQQLLQSSTSHIFSDESAEPRSNWILCISEEKWKYTLEWVTSVHINRNTRVHVCSRGYTVWLLIHDGKCRVKHVACAKLVRMHAAIAAAHQCIVRHVTAGLSKTLESKDTLSSFSLPARAVAFRLPVSSPSHRRCQQCIISG